MVEVVWNQSSAHSSPLSSHSEWILVMSLGLTIILWTPNLYHQPWPLPCFSLSCLFCVIFCLFNVCLKFNLPISLRGLPEIHRKKAKNYDAPDWLMSTHIKNHHRIYRKPNSLSCLKGTHHYWEVFHLSIKWMDFRDFYLRNFLLGVNKLII